MLSLLRSAAVPHNNNGGFDNGGLLVGVPGRLHGRACRPVFVPDARLAAAAACAGRPAASLLLLAAGGELRSLAEAAGDGGGRRRGWRSRRRRQRVGDDLRHGVLDRLLLPVRSSGRLRHTSSESNAVSRSIPPSIQ